MATTTYGSPYVASSDLVSGWPTASQNVANRIDDVALKGNGVNAQTAAGYTLVLTDAGKTVTLSNASAQNLTIPTNASVAFPTGTLIRVVNLGAGTWTLTGTPTINGTTKIPNKGAVQLLKTGTDTWWASALDTAVPSGLKLISESSFSASSAVNVNNVFTSTYDWYRVHVDFSMTVTNAVNMRMRASGADNSSASYTNQSLVAASTSVTAGVVSAGNIVEIGNGHTAAAGNYIIIDFAQPNLAAVTSWRAWSMRTDGAQYQYSGFFNNTTQFDGFSLIPAAGTITSATNGLRIYGYSNL